MLQLEEVIFAVCLGIISVPIWLQIKRPLPQIRTEPSTPDPTPPPSPKFYDIRTSYDEGEIAGLITELYELLVMLAYFSRDDIIWPPSENGHNINENLCKELDLDPAVISLMKRIPYAGSNFRSTFDLFPDSRPYSFLDDDDIIASRDPERVPNGQQNDLRMDYLPPHDISLSEHHLEEGLPVVLDTKENTVRLIPWEWNLVDLRSFKLERPDHPLHYRNLPAQHAPSYFRSLIKRIKALELIPSGSEQFGRKYYGHRDTIVRDDVRAILIEKYGWPNNFKTDDWARDVEEVWNRVIRKDLDLQQEKAR